MYLRKAKHTKDIIAPFALAISKVPKGNPRVPKLYKTQLQICFMLCFEIHSFTKLLPSLFYEYVL